MGRVACSATSTSRSEYVDTMESLIVRAEAIPRRPRRSLELLLTGFRPALCVNPPTERRHWIFLQ